MYRQNLFCSSSKEVRHLAKILSKDPRSTLYRNIHHIEHIYGLSPWNFSYWRILREKIEIAMVPPNNEWRMTFLMKLLSTRLQKSSLLEYTSHLTEMIDSLSNTQTWFIFFSLGLLENSHYLKIMIIIIYWKERSIIFSIINLTIYLSLNKEYNNADTLICTY